MATRRNLAIGGAAAVALCTALLVAARDGGGDDASAAAPAVLTVSLVMPERGAMPLRVPATGHVAAWREAGIGAEIAGLRITAVHADVGDTVRAGQLLAELDRAVVAAELAEAEAAVVQARAEADEAASNARRARGLEGSGAMSAQQIEQYQVAAATASARVAGAVAQAQLRRVRLSQTRIVAPGDGVITARAATVGAVAGDGLFTLVRDGRLEWRARIATADLAALSPGQVAVLEMPGGSTLRGTLRVVAPTIDAGSHDGVAYIDLPADPRLRAGLFVRGGIVAGDRDVLTLPRSAVLLRDGFSYVAQVGDDARVALRKVDVGGRASDRVLVTSGLTERDAVVREGVGFLGEGDRVRVVGEPTTTPTAAPGAAP